MINAQLGGMQANGALPYVFLNHFTAYQLAVGTLLGLITGGFALIKSRNMFARGNRYFLFACVGNWPFSWVIEDFTYFLFNPLDALSSTHWSTWFLGGVYAYSPWMPGHPKPEFFIPTWYFLAFAWFLGCQWYAHRCTVYDATIKDELGQEILPKPLPTPVLETRTPRPPRLQWLRKKLSRRNVSPTPLPTPLPAPEIEKHEPPHPSRVPRSIPKIQPPKKKETPVAPTPKPPARSPDAEAALKRMREKWVRNDGKASASD